MIHVTKLNNFIKRNCKEICNQLHYCQSRVFSASLSYRELRFTWTELISNSHGTPSYWQYTVLVPTSPAEVSDVIPLPPLTTVYLFLFWSSDQVALFISLEVNIVKIEEKFLFEAALRTR